MMLVRRPKPQKGQITVGQRLASWRRHRHWGVSTRFVFQARHRECLQQRRLGVADADHRGRHIRHAALSGVVRQHCGLQLPHRHRATFGVGGHRPLPKHRLRADSHVFAHLRHRSERHLAQHAHRRSNDVDGQYSAGAGFVETVDKNAIISIFASYKRNY